MVRKLSTAMAVLVVIVVGILIGPAQAQQCDDARFAAEFESKFGSSRQAGLDDCGAIALQLEALTYMKGMQRACFSGSDLQAMLADADRTIAQSEQSYRQNFCGEPPRFSERPVAGSSNTPTGYKMGPHTWGALTPCPPGEDCELYARTLRSMHNSTTMTWVDRDVAYYAEMFAKGGMTLSELLEKARSGCEEVDQWAPDGWERSGCDNYEAIVREAYKSAAAASKAAPASPAAPAPSASNRRMVIEKEMFTSWVTVDDPKPGFLIHIQNHTNKGIKCTVTYFYIEEDVTSGTAIKERPNKDRRTLHVGAGSTEYYGITTSQDLPKIYPRIKEYSIRCKRG